MKPRFVKTLYIEVILIISRIYTISSAFIINGKMQLYRSLLPALLALLKPLAFATESDNLIFFSLIAQLNIHILTSFPCPYDYYLER